MSRKLTEKWKYIGITGKNGKPSIIEFVKEYHNTIGIFSLFICYLDEEVNVLIHQICRQQNFILVAQDCDRL